LATSWGNLASHEERKPYRHGEGTITLRKDGRYAVGITLENGKRKFYYAKSKKEALELLRRVQQGTLVEGPQQTLGQFLAEWLQTHKQSIRPRSYERYEAIIRLHLVPTLGRVKLRKLTAQQLDRLYAQKLEQGLHPTTVTAIHNMLHTALDKAIRLGLLARNVCELVSPPRAVHKEMKPLTLEQIYALLEAAKGHPLLSTKLDFGDIRKYHDYHIERYPSLPLRCVFNSYSP